MPSPFAFLFNRTGNRNALIAFLKLDASAQARVKDAIKDIGYPYRRQSLTESAKRLHEELKVMDADTMFDILDAITDFIPMPRQLLTDAIAETLKDTGMSPAPLETLVLEVSSDARFKQQKDVQEFKSRAVPSLDSFEYICAIRGRFDKQFDYDKDNISSYAPTLVDNHPVLIVELDSHGPTDPFIFQVDQEQLDRLISDLIAAQKQLKILVDSVDLRKDSARAS